MQNSSIAWEARTHACAHARTRTVGINLCIINEKGHIEIVEKVQETSSDTGMHDRAITVLHEL